MSEATTAILSDIAASLKAVIHTTPGAKRKLHIKKSRNPGGVYSDGAEGVQTDDYAI